MSHRRKARTKSIDAVPDRHVRKPGFARLEVAAEAARIIATEGQSNYQAAKRKAAERVGVSDRLALPSNLEVQDALHRYQALYGGDQHRSNLEQMRAVALEAMRGLEAFSPRLVGPVLDGTAGRHSRVSLHLFSDTTENLVLRFLDQGMDYAQEQRRIRWHDGEHRTLPVLVIEVRGVKVELVVFPTLAIRQAPPSPIDGRPQQRATPAEVQLLLERRAEARESFA